MTLTVSVKVKLFASFRTMRFKEKQLTVRPGTTPEDILTDLGIPIKDLGILMINRRQQPIDTILTNGDTVALFPVVGGG